MKVSTLELSNDELSQLAKLMEEVSPHNLSPMWELRERGPNTRAYQGMGLWILTEVQLQREEGIGIDAVFETTWLHVAVSRFDRVPDYAELEEVKRVFVGRDRKAIQVFPAEKESFNSRLGIDRTCCLHLFASLNEHDPLPDFRDAAGKI